MLEKVGNNYCFMVKEIDRLHRDFKERPIPIGLKCAGPNLSIYMEKINNFFSYVI